MRRCAVLMLVLFASTPAAASCVHLMSADIGMYLDCRFREQNEAINQHAGVIVDIAKDVQTQNGAISSLQSLLFFTDDMTKENTSSIAVLQNENKKLQQRINDLEATMKAILNRQEDQ